MEPPSFFKLLVKPGEEDEYIRRHDNVWPQVTRDLETAGVAVSCKQALSLLLYIHFALTYTDASADSAQYFFRIWTHTMFTRALRYLLIANSLP